MSLGLEGERSELGSGSLRGESPLCKTFPFFCCIKKRFGRLCLLSETSLIVDNTFVSEANTTFNVFGGVVFPVDEYVLVNESWYVAGL